jgi:hypothetical protein
MHMAWAKQPITLICDVMLASCLVQKKKGADKSERCRTGAPAGVHAMPEGRRLMRRGERGVGRRTKAAACLSLWGKKGPFIRMSFYDNKRLAVPLPAVRFRFPFRRRPYSLHLPSPLIPCLLQLLHGLASRYYWYPTFSSLLKPVDFHFLAGLKKVKHDFLPFGTFTIKYGS